MLDRAHSNFIKIPEMIKLVTEQRYNRITKLVMLCYNQEIEGVLSMKKSGNDCCSKFIYGSSHRINCTIFRS